jgi:hypothetical protein
LETTVGAWVEIHLIYGFGFVFQFLKKTAPSERLRFGSCESEAGLFVVKL